MAYNTDINFELKFTIKDIVVTYNNGFTVARIKVNKAKGYPDPLPKVITIKGVFANVFKGDTYKSNVKFEYDDKFGYSLRQNGAAELILPHSNKELAKFLKQRTTGISEELLREVIDTIGIDIISKVAEDEHVLDGIDKLTTKKREILIAVCKENVIFESLFAYLMYEQFPASLAAKIYKEYGYNSLGQIKKNPYEIFMKGFISFEDADRLAYKGGSFEWNNKERIKAIVYRAVLDWEGSKGNTFISEIALKYKIKEFAKKDINTGFGVHKISEVEMFDAVNNLIGSSVLIKTNYIDDEQKEHTVYCRKYVYDTEASIARMLKERINSDNLFCVPVVAIDDYLFNLKRNRVKLSEEQENAVRMALRSKISILTGGPGTGKTYTVNLIVGALKALFKRINVTLLAPTGRAAYRIKQVSNEEAKTIHSALHLFDDTDDIDSKFILETDFVIIDESSMIDEKLFETVLKRISPTASILLVGDNDQLPSVNIGNVLGDLLATPYIPYTELRQIFRQEGTSRIVENAHKIKSGDEKEIMTMSFGKGKNDDFRIIEASNDDECADRVIAEYKRIIETEAIEDVLVISPMRANFSGIDSLNLRIQNEVNPHRDGFYEVKRGSKIIRSGDRVIHTKNNKRLAVVNGALGTVLDVYRDEDKNEDVIEVLFDGETDVVTYRKTDDIKELELGYCISIHKSQGSEINHIIMPLTNQHSLMLRRRLLYTAITRAKESFCCVGTKELLLKSCMNTKGDNRYSLLGNLLKS